MKRLLLSLFGLSLLAVACSIAVDNELSSGVPTGGTSSFDQMCPEDFAVSLSDVQYYVEWKAAGCDVDNPSIFILNYPNDTWEILSSDMRTSTVLAAGCGKFSMDMDNSNLVGFIKDMAAEVAYLHSYSGEIKNAQERYLGWKEIIRSGKSIKQYGAVSYCAEPVNAQFARTRSTAEPDTSYHPVPGYYCRLNAEGDFVTAAIRNHLTTTQWGESAPYNQYCHINPENNSLRAPAGSEAVAGGQMVYFLHYDGDMCPEVYGSAYCSAYISNNMDWNAMGQYGTWRRVWYVGSRI